MRSTAKKPSGKSKVLIVDDEKIFLETLSYKLGREGFEVVQAKSGKEALELIRKEHPSVILLDILMPDMSGLDVLSELKEDPKTRHIPVVLVTILNEFTDVEKGLALGAEFYIVKEDKNIDDVVERIRGLIR